MNNEFISISRYRLLRTITMDKQEEKNVIFVHNSIKENSTIEIEYYVSTKSIVDIIMSDYCELVSAQYIEMKTLNNTCKNDLTQ